MTSLKNRTGLEKLKWHCAKAVGFNMLGLGFISISVSLKTSQIYLGVSDCIKGKNFEKLHAIFFTALS